VLLVDAGQLVIDGFITGMESRYDAVRRSLAGLTADIAGMPVDPLGTRGPGLTSRVVGALTDSTGEQPAAKVFNYYAAPGASLGAEEDLFTAVGRARMVGW
jgi:hypothetical protein